MSTASAAALESDGAGAPAPRRGRILAMLGMAQLMVVLDTTIVNIGLPSAQADLGFSDGSRQWIITAHPPWPPTPGSDSPPTSSPG